ncbi:hypothetical protein F4861DRAFT_413347 [Xylaria intraflava]|nr:hypothetical protein F4861DRAFT_413347 [Xylaria intraflava]
MHRQSAFLPGHVATRSCTDPSSFCARLSTRQRSTRVAWHANALPPRGASRQVATMATQPFSLSASDNLSLRMVYCESTALCYRVIAIKILSTDNTMATFCRTAKPLPARNQTFALPMLPRLHSYKCHMGQCVERDQSYMGCRADDSYSQTHRLAAMSSLSRRACYKCGNVGHYAEVCSSAERLCYNCKQPGTSRSDLSYVAWPPG